VEALSLNCPQCGAELGLNLAVLGLNSVPVPQLEAQPSVGGVRASKRLKYQYNDQTFQEFWQVYPRRVGKASAFSRWLIVVKEIDAKIVIDAARSYAKYCATRNLEDRFIKYPEGWLAAGRWDDELETVAAANEGDPAYIVGTAEYAARVQAEEDRAIEEISYEL